MSGRAEPVRPPWESWLVYVDWLLERDCALVLEPPREEDWDPRPWRRPGYLQPGTPLEERYRVEGLARISEERFFYLARDSEERRCLITTRWRLWDEAADEDMESILASCADPRIAARELLRAAHHGGGMDNISLVVVVIPQLSGHEETVLVQP